MQQDKLTIVISRESITDMALENLQKITANKQTLFQRAFRTDSTEIEITEEKINFTWFPYTADGDEITTYTQFISRLCDMARDAKRVSSKPTETDNDKYAFRCFLLRLGFIGKEYKSVRKILLRNLTGNSAFRSVKYRMRVLTHAAVNTLILYFFIVICTAILETSCRVFCSLQRCASDLIRFSTSFCPKESRERYNFIRSV